MAAAAGAMLCVVVEELLPETTRTGAVDVATLGFILGFVVIMASTTRWEIAGRLWEKIRDDFLTASSYNF
jgi:hypothetical protein